MAIIDSRHSWIRKHSVLLILLAGYLVTSTIVIEQQQTIESQRVLIRELFQDSMELSNLKMKQAVVVKR